MTENEVLIKTPEEAIETIKSNMPTSGYQMLRESLDMAIIALKEIQQYREIGTVEECREAAEKWKAKKAEFYGDSEDGKLLCPNCGEDLWELKECGFTNCPYCGQAIQWDENLEGME